MKNMKLYYILHTASYSMNQAASQHPRQELCSKFEAASLLRPVGRGADRRPRRASAPVGSGAVPRGIDRGIDRGAPTTVAAVVAAPAARQMGSGGMGCILGNDIYESDP